MENLRPLERRINAMRDEGVATGEIAQRVGRSPAQVERFHAGVYRIAHDMHAQPQTVGLVAKSGIPIFGQVDARRNIAKLAHDVFGNAPLRLRSGGELRRRRSSSYSRMTFLSIWTAATG